VTAAARLLGVYLGDAGVGGLLRERRRGLLLEELREIDVAELLAAGQVAQRRVR
jgi:hypothetical protein